MKLTQLEYFCVAARYHNITRASKELFVTQPSVSNAIKALEEEFGINLFYRNNNKLTLTPEGEKFYQSAEELLAHADAVRSELHELWNPSHAWNHLSAGYVSFFEGRIP